MTFGLPRELPPLISLAVGVALLALPRARAALSKGSLGSFLAVASGLAALLSGAYVAVYLRGGPRIIDATTYFLQARALSEGLLAWPDVEPSQSFVGRFLVRDTLAGADHVAGIFPTGYPLLLAAGFLLGAPMSVGPLLAIGVTYATAFVCDAALPEQLPASQRDAAIRLAVGLSVGCATLRYHTADTMSHGLAACLFATAVGAALRLGRRGALADAALLGAALGWLACTRPVSALALVPIVALAVAPRLSLAGAALSLASASPFVALFFAHQRAATGALGASSQSLYYAQSDHPAGCFRYGLGASVGCRFEHGDFVERYLPSGYGVVEALGTTARRLALHAGDATNAAPLGVALLVALVLAVRRSRELRLAALAVPALVVTYAPFYFDGNVPGAGARLFADALPVEHALLAWLIAQRSLALRLEHGGALAVGAVLAGFAFFTHVDHEQLRDREGGRPMFEPAVLEAANVRGGLVLVDTDHAFALGFDPRARARADAIEVARLRGDALDTFLWEARGRPPIFSYRFDVATGRVAVAPHAPPQATRLEGEHLWPALEQAGAAVVPVHDAHPCVSRGRLLAVSSQGRGLARLKLPAQLAGKTLRPVVSLGEGASARLSLKAHGQVRSSVQAVAPSLERSCIRLGPLSSRDSDGSLELEIELGLGAGGAGLLGLDRLEIEGEAPGRSATRPNNSENPRQ